MTGEGAGWFDRLTMSGPCYSTNGLTMSGPCYSTNGLTMSGPCYSTNGLTMSGVLGHARGGRRGIVCIAGEVLRHDGYRRGRAR